jgi:hypothetical protein
LAGSARLGSIEFFFGSARLRLGSIKKNSARLDCRLGSTKFFRLGSIAGSARLKNPIEPNP